LIFEEIDKGYYGGKAKEANLNLACALISDLGKSKEIILTNLVERGKLKENN